MIEGTGGGCHAALIVFDSSGYEPPPPRIEEVPVPGALPPALTAAGILADEE